LFIEFIVKKEICGIKNEVRRVNKLVFRQNSMLGNVRPFFFYNVNDKIYRDIGEQGNHIQRNETEIIRNVYI